MKKCSLSLLLCASLAAPVAAMACPADALGTSRTLTLKREFAAYGQVQHGPLPLQKGEVVLTFDDGPVPGLIERVLDILSTQCVQATFFMTGANLAEHPELGKRVAQAGHTPALHSFAHPSLRAMPPAGQLADLDKGIQAFTKVFDGPPPAYRFPYLEETPPILAALKEKNVTVASVDLGIDDYLPNDMRSAALVERLVARLGQTGGGILLMHDANPPTVEALPALLKAIKDNGYKVVHLRWEE